MKLPLTLAAFSALGALAQPKTIRDVDFRNQNYPHNAAKTLRSPVGWKSPVGYGSVMLRGGRWDKSEEEEIFSGLTLEETLFGDLTGDGGEEAIAVLRYDTGGTMNWHVLYMFAMESKGPKVLAFFHAGDRSDQGLSRVTIERGLLVVELFDPKKSTGDCCSSGILRTRYQWNGTAFRRVGPVVSFKAEHVSRRPVNVFGIPVER